MATTTLRTQNADGDSVSLSAHVEEDKAEESVEAIHRFAELEAEAQTAALRKDLDSAKGENETLRETIVSETIRAKKLAGVVSDDDDAELSVEDEREYLLGLPASRLQMEYERATKKDLTGAASSTTSNEKPDDPGAQEYDQAVSDLE